MNKPVITAEQLHKKFVYTGFWGGGKAGHIVQAVNNVSFSINAGEILGLVGESGCGKTTIGKIIAGFIRPDSGSITFQGKRLNSFPRRKLIRPVQMIFQDPFASLNPKLSIGVQLAEAVQQGNWELPLGRFEINKNITYYLERVGLSHKFIHGYPHQFSGGELQRVVIARALAMQPKIIIADEPVSSLDLSIQAQILNLLKEIKHGFDLSYLFITHDLSVVRYMADRVLVMKDGGIVEEGEIGTVLFHPKHPYTQQLIEAIPEIPV